MMSEYVSIDRNTNFVWARPGNSKLSRSLQTIRLNLTNSGKNPVRNCHTFCGKSQNMKLSARNVDTNAEITA